MQKPKFTVFTQLHETNNGQIIGYFDRSKRAFSKALRETFHAYKNDPSFKKSKYNTYLQNEYGITKRTAGSIITEAEGRYNALLESKKYEKRQLENKIAFFEDKLIPDLQAKRDENCKKLRNNQYVDLQSHRNLKLKLNAKKNKLNHMKQTVNNLEYQIRTGKLKLCFGTKRLLKSDYDAFVEQRDSQMSFVGCKSEVHCNQNFQLTYNPRNNQFDIKMRMDFGGYKDCKTDERFIYGKVYFNHHKKEIIQILQNKNSPLSFMIIKRNGRYYLYCTFEIQYEPSDIVTSNFFGTIGLDFNKGFITLTETNEYGHMIQTQFLPYRFRQGNKTTTDIEQIANHIAKLAIKTSKDIVIEDLDFKKKKSKTETKRGKKYNEMLHSLAYKEYSETIDSIAYRNRVHVIKVNPAWTSWIAKKKYCPQMKLNTHVGASFVIARRGQGFMDQV